MDTKSNHEIPRAGEPPAEEIRTRQNSRGVPVPERPERYEPAGYGGERPVTAKGEKRGRKLNKPMGILLFLAALGLLTLMVYGFVIVMCAAGEGRVIGNLDGDYIRFYSSDAESRFSDSAAEALEVLYKALTDDLSINPAAYGKEGEGSAAVQPWHRNMLIGVQGVKYYVVLPDGSYHSNIEGYVPGAAAELYEQYDAQFLHPLSDPPEEFIWRLGHWNRYRATLEKYNAKGVVFFTSDGPWMDAIRQNYEIARRLNLLPPIIVFSAFALALTLFLGMTLWRKSFLWAFGGLYGVYGKQPLFVKLALAAVSVIYIMLLQDSVYWFFSYYGGAGLVAPTLLLLSAALLYAKYSLIYFIVLLKGGRRALRMEPDARWAFKLLHNTKAVFRLKNIPLIICLLLLYLSVIASVVVFCAGIVAIGYEMPAALILLSLSAAAFCICAMFVSLIHAFAKTAEYAKSIAEGVYPEIIEASGWFSQPAAYLSRINDGTRRAVEEAVRSERMKAELITNVSHDLKTPLTSIINYVELLKGTPLTQSEAAAEYIGVIDAKTQRLKVLIEDLFEAAKLNSGSAAMEWEDVNVVDLLKQTLGELDEKILESGIIFLTRYSAEHITLRLDGKKMWRAFENLICNILKYAPAGSRAYISAEETSGGRVEIIFKNVANYEMDFNADELFERFVRGDASRSTEGSGLGLSIARGIVEHCGGSMRITTDGDLFKAAILFN